MQESSSSRLNRKLGKHFPVLAAMLTASLAVLVISVFPAPASKIIQFLPAATSTASVTVANVAPVASSASLNGESDIVLTEGTTTPEVVTGTVTDANGCVDLTSIVIKVYTGTLGSCTVTNNTTCYITTLSSPSTDASCTGGSDTTVAISSSNATFNMQYYATPGTWKASIIPSDGGGAGTTSSSSGTTLDSLTALEVSSTITYGSVANGANSSGDHIATVTNTGNIAIDYNLSGADLTCTTIGSIPKGDQQYGTSSFSYGGGTALTATPALVSANIAVQTSGTPVTASSYWQITVPNGVSGTCSGNVTFAAVAH